MQTLRFIVVKKLCTIISHYSLIPKPMHFSQCKTSIHVTLQSSQVGDSQYSFVQQGTNEHLGPSAVKWWKARALELFLSNFCTHVIILPISWKGRHWFGGNGVNLRARISNKLAGNGCAVGPWNTLWEGENYILQYAWNAATLNWDVLCNTCKIRSGHQWLNMKKIQNISLIF